jgi:hypothetical protein
MTEDQIREIAEAIGGLLGLLNEADPRDRAEIYSRIGVRMTYRPGTETLLTQVVSTAINRVPVWCPRPHTA